MQASALELPDPRPDPLAQLTARELLIALDEEVQRLAVSLGADPQELAEALYFVSSASEHSSANLNILRQSSRAAVAGVGEVMVRLPDLTDAEPLARMAKVIAAFR